MDLTTFYKHALQWKRQQQEAEQRLVDQYAASVRAVWKSMAELIRAELPIEGMTIHETHLDQFVDFPRAGWLVDVDCSFDPAVAQAIATGQGELQPGVIRVQLLWDQAWKIERYQVLLDGRITEFEHPYEAFLSVYPALQEKV